MVLGIGCNEVIEDGIAVEWGERGRIAMRGRRMRGHCKGKERKEKGNECVDAELLGTDEECRLMT